MSIFVDMQESVKCFEVRCQYSLTCKQVFSALRLDVNIRCQRILTSNL